jgi:imidazolonepropionase-like amidohydrolase
MTRAAIGFVAALAAVVALDNVQAQSPDGGVTALTGARLLDGTGRPPVEQATVVIAPNGRLLAAGPASAIQIPSSAARVDLSGGAARVMKLDDLGLLQTGRQADLVVLNANPLADIRNTRQISSVWIGGRRLAPAAQ